MERVLHITGITVMFAHAPRVTQGNIVKQTSTSALPTLIAVTSMLSVITLVDLTLAHVKLDFLEMVDPAVNVQATQV